MRSTPSSVRVMTRKSVACQAIEAGSASRRELRVVQPVSTMFTHTARSAVPRPVAGGSNRRSIDPPAQRERSWTTDSLLREGGYCTEAGRESQEPGEVPGVRLAHGDYGIALRPGLSQ